MNPFNWHAVRRQDQPDRKEQPGKKGNWMLGVAVGVLCILAVVLVLEAVRTW